MPCCFVFPGQGSQNVGRGKDLYSHFPEVRELYQEASDVLGYDVAELSFNGPKEELNKTFRTQPCLLTASVAAARALTARGKTPDAVAGHSLGEYSALVVAGSMSFSDAVKITEVRGRIMQEAVPEGKGLMAAILGLEREVLDAVCARVSEGYVAAANYNCPGQIVISGEKNAVEQAMALAKEAGAKRAMPLSVSVPSHSRLMEEAGARFQEALRSIDIIAAGVSFVNNTEARFISAADDIRSALIRQLSRPVLWEDCVRTLSGGGITTFVETGPGKVLTGLIKRIAPAAVLHSVEDMATLEKTLGEF